MCGRFGEDSRPIDALMHWLLNDLNPARIQNPGRVNTVSILLNNAVNFVAGEEKFVHKGGLVYTPLPPVWVFEIRCRRRRSIPLLGGEFDRSAIKTHTGGKGGVTTLPILQEFSTKLPGVENFYNIGFDPNISLIHYFINIYGELSFRKRVV